MEELLNLIISEYKDFMKNPKVRNLWGLVNDGTATFKEACEFSKITADEMSRLLVKYIGVGSGVVYSSDEIETIIRTTLAQTYDSTASFSAQVQAVLNDNAKINIKAKKAQIDKSRIDNLINKLKNGEAVVAGDLITEDTEWLIESNVVENISRSAVEDTIFENATLLSNAGFKTVMTRHLDPSGCCKWCQSMAGTYTKGSEPDDFWRVHKDCGCWIEYKPVKKATSYVRYTSVNGKRKKITS